MMQIGWIDFSREDRDRAKRLISLIRPEGQLDELGVGRVRDGLADKLFPGISTIQTRAKYFFLIPYIIRDYLSLHIAERKKINPEKYLEEEQHQIKNILRRKYLGKENTGVIGITLSENSKIVRPPSVIYWVGIHRFNCMQTQELSLSAYLRKLQQTTLLELAEKRNENDPTDDIDAAMDDNINDILVPYCPLWKENIDIELTPDEADFLEEAFKDQRNLFLKDSVLREVFNNNLLLEIFLQEDNIQSFARKAIALDISEGLKRSLIRAHDFSYIIEGAHILYNHLLQERFFEKQHENVFLNLFIAWHGNLNNTMIDFQGFHTRWIDDPYGFFASWWRYVQEPNIDDATMCEMQKLIQRRELLSKGRKARLRNARETNPDMEPNKWIGIGLLSYRYRNAKRIVEDIIKAKKND